MTYQDRTNESKHAVEKLQELWLQIVSPTPLPTRDQLEKWCAIHKNQTEFLELGFRAAARRQRGRTWNDALHVVAFVSSVANSHRSLAQARRAA